MIDIKDFKVGQLAYRLSTDKSTSPCTTEVTCVGRKYVTVKQGIWSMKFSVEWSDDALVEKVDYGSSSLLFVSKEACEDYLEKKSLEAWLRDAVSRCGRMRYSLEQLRKVKEILEGEG